MNRMRQGEGEMNRIRQGEGEGEMNRMRRGRERDR